MQRLRKQISLDYQRAHNRITFDSVAHTLPGSFTYVTIPAVPEICKSAARIDIPKYPFHKQFDSFIFNSFLTRPEAIMSLGDVRTECNKVSYRTLRQIAWGGGGGGGVGGVHCPTHKERPITKLLMGVRTPNEMPNSARRVATQMGALVVAIDVLSTRIIF